MDAQNLARWTRFAGKGGIGRCVAVQDCVAESPEDLMFLKGDEIVVLVQLSDEGRFLGYCEGVVGQFSSNDVQFTTKLKKAVFAKRPSSTSPHSSTHPASSPGLLAPSPGPGPSPTAQSFRGSIMAESRPASVSAAVSKHGVGVDMLPVGSTVVYPPPGMFSPPRSAIDLPGSGSGSERNSPAPNYGGGRMSPAAGRQSPATRSRSNLSPPPPPSSSSSSSPAGSRILSPPQRNAELPSLAAVAMKSKVGATGRQGSSGGESSPTPGATGQRGRPLASRHARERTDDSLVSIASNTDDDDDANTTESHDNHELLRRMKAFPAPPTTIPHNRNLSTSTMATSVGGHSLSPPHSPRNASFVGGSPRFGNGTTASLAPSPSQSPRSATFGNSAMPSPQMQSFSSVMHTGSGSSPGPNSGSGTGTGSPSPRRPMFPGPGQQQHSTTQSVQISRSTPSPSATGTSGPPRHLPASASTGSLSALVASASASSNSLNRISPSTSASGAGAGFASHKDRGGAPPPRPSRASSRASTSSIQSLTAQAQTQTQIQPTNRKRTGSASLLDLDLHSREPSFASVLHSRNVSSLSGSGSASSQGSGSSTPARMREREARELELDIQTALALLGTGGGGQDSGGLATATLDGSMLTPRPGMASSAFGSSPVPPRNTTTNRSGTASTASSASLPGYQHQHQQQRRVVNRPESGDSTWHRPGGGGGHDDDDSSGTDSERENGRGPFALDPLERRLPSALALQRHPDSRSVSASEDEDRALISGSTFGRDGDGGSTAGLMSEDDATVDGHGHTAGVLERMQRSSFARIEQERHQQQQQHRHGVEDFDYETRLAQDRGGGGGLKRSDTSTSKMSTRSGEWDIGNSLMQGLDSSDEEEDHHSWNQRGPVVRPNPNIQTQTPPRQQPQQRAFLHPGDAVYSTPNANGIKSQPVAERYSPSGSSNGASGRGYSPSASSSNIHGGDSSFTSTFSPSESNRSLAPSSVLVVHSDSNRSLAPSSLMPNSDSNRSLALNASESNRSFTSGSSNSTNPMQLANSNSQTRQPVAPVSDPDTSLAGNSTMQHADDEGDEDDDGEEWDGDSIYDGYRYSRYSMVSKRASKFTLPDKDKNALAGGGQPFGSMASFGSSSSAGGLGSPDIPQRGKARERSYSQRSGASSPMSSDSRAQSRTQKRAGTPSSPSSPLGPNAGGELAVRNAGFAAALVVRSDAPTLSVPGATSSKWTPSPTLPLSPNRQASFANQQATRGPTLPLTPTKPLTPVKLQSPQSPSSDEVEVSPVPSHKPVTPRPHPPILPIEDPFAKDKRLTVASSTDRGSILDLTQELGMDLAAVGSTSGLAMIAEVHVSPDREEDGAQYASALSPSDALLARGTFASAPTSATSSHFEPTPSPRHGGAFVFPPGKASPSSLVPRPGRQMFTGQHSDVVERAGPLSASPEPIDEDATVTSLNPPRQPQSSGPKLLTVTVPPPGFGTSKSPSSPNFPLMSASALRARFEDERRGQGSVSLEPRPGPTLHVANADDRSDRIDDSDESVYSSARHSRVPSTANGQDGHDDQRPPSGMAIVTEEERPPANGRAPQDAAVIFSPVASVPPNFTQLESSISGMPRQPPPNYVDSQAPPRAPLQQSGFTEDQLQFNRQRRPGGDLEIDTTPQAPNVATFGDLSITPQQRHHMQNVATPDSPSPMNTMARPIGMGMSNSSGRNSPAPANFLPHPNAPMSRPPRLLPGTGVGSGVFNPYAGDSGGSAPPNSDSARRPPPLHETMAMAASQRGMTIRGRMQLDLSSASAPVPVVWAMLSEVQAHAEEQQELVSPAAMSPHSPARSSPSRLAPKGPPHPHPLSNAATAPPTGPASAGPLGPGPSPWRGPGTPPQNERRQIASVQITSSAQAGSLGPAWKAGTPPPRVGPADSTSLNAQSTSSPLSRNQFIPQVGGLRPRSRSFSGFTGNLDGPASRGTAIPPSGGPGRLDAQQVPFPSRPNEDSRQQQGARPTGGGPPQPQMGRMQRMPSMPALGPSPLAIPNGVSNKSNPTSPLSRSNISSPIAITSATSRRLGPDETPTSPLSSSPRRNVGLRHASSAMNMGTVARSQSPASRPSRTSGHGDDDDNSDPSRESGGRPSRSLSLRSKISLSALRAKAAADAQREAEATVNVQDMEFELVRPVAPATRDGEGEPQREFESVRSGRDSARSGSPGGASSQAHDGPSSALSPVSGGAPSQASLDAYRAREQKWMTLISTTQRKNKKVRKLVLEGVPASVRSRVWAYLTDSKSRQTPGVFGQLSAKGNPQLSDRIESDLQRLFSSESHLAEPKGRGPVVNILQAYFVMVPDVPYQPDLAIVAGNLALQCPEEEAFWTLVQLMESHLRGYFSAIPVQIDVDGPLFAKALDYADSALSIRLFADLHVNPAELCQSWFLSLFSRTLPTDIQYRVWDIFLYEGPTFLFRVGLALLQVLRRQIFSMQNVSVPQVIGFLTRPPQQAFLPDPEAFISLCFEMRIKEDDIRKARIKNAEQLLKERQQGRFAARPVRR